MGSYRIKIRELRNGEKEYIAQFREGKGFIDFLFGDAWQGIHLDMHGNPDHSLTTCSVFGTKEDAMLMIERHRAVIAEASKKDTVRVSYMDVA